MRCFALGCLNYTPVRFGHSRIGDILDAMTGFIDAENDRIKALASIVRTATTKLWNTQIIESDRLTEIKLWRFPWEKQEDVPNNEANKEELKRDADAQAEYLLKYFP